MFQVKNQLRIALIYFIIAAAMGGVLRLFSVLSISLNYKHIIHGHSHIALLGWVYLGFISLLYYLFLNEKVLTKKYKRFLLITHLSVLGMMISFPIQGYAIFSIFFSTLFLFTSYWFTAYFIKNVPKGKRTFSFQCMKVGLILFVISSVGPWSLGGIMTALGATSVWYKAAIYFYLHFLYNGAFMLFLFGLLFRIYEMNGVELTLSKQKRWMRIFISGIILSFFLSILFFDVPVWVNVIAIIGAFLQLYFIVLMIQFLFENRGSISQFNNHLSRVMLRLLMLFVLIKYVVQILSGFPQLTSFIIESHDFIIAYLHFVFLGIISLGLLFFLYYFKLLRLPFVTYWLFIFGVVLSEVFLILRGMFQVFKVELISGFNWGLWGVSILIPMSLIIGLIGLKNKLNENK